MVKVGQKVRFDPFGYVTGMGADTVRGEMVIGTVVMVNDKHHWFSVEYGDSNQRTLFMFCDIGEAVTIIG